MMLEAGVIQARGGTLPGRVLVAFSLSSCRKPPRACTRSRPVHVHGIGIQYWLISMPYTR